MSGFILGLTGGVASGKSTVEALFRALGIVIADADAAARSAVAVGTSGLAEVVAAFGAEVLAADGSLDRAAMRQRVFADPQARRQLEAIVHPRVRATLHAECAAAGGPYAVTSIPLLAEGGGRQAYPWLQRILVVDVSPETQLQRLLRRDEIDPALARSMIGAQATRAQRLAIADDVLSNEATPEALEPQVVALDRLYRKLAAETGR